MMPARPHYETEEDLKREREFIEKICKKFKVEHHKLKAKVYKIDYFLTRHGRGVCWCEIKCRRCSQSKYETYMISVDKINSLYHLSKCTGLAAMVFLRWTDVDGYANLQDFFPKKPIIGWGGRDDRDDPLDKEPVFYIEMHYFKHFKE